MPLLTLTKPDHNTQSGSAYKVNINNAIDEIGDQPAVRGITTLPLFNAPFKNSLAFDGQGYIDFTRASTAIYLDRYGVLQTAAIDEPRFEKNGLLIEGASTNLFTRSEDFSHADWVQSGTGTVTPNAINAPDGTLTADLLDDTDTDLSEAYWQQTKTVADDSLIRSCSFFLKEGTALETTVGVFLIGGGTPVGVVGVVTWATNTLDVGVLTALADGWYRADVAITNNGTGNTSLTGRIYPAGQDVSVTGTAYAWGGQLEELPFASSYIPTTTVAVTRSADVCTLTPADNVPSINEDISIICDVDILGFNGAINQYIFKDAGVNFVNFIAAINSSNGNIHANIGGPNTFLTNSLTPGQVARIGVANTPTTAKGYFNGVLDLSVARDTQTGDYSTLYIGQSNTGAHLFGHLSNLRIYDVALTDDQMRIA